MTDDDVMIVSEEAIASQKELSDVPTPELFEQLSDIVVQLGVRDRISPRELFDGILQYNEDTLEEAIQVMTHVLAGGK